MRFGGFDKILFFSVCGILLIGIMTLYSASAAYNSHAIILRQIFWIFFGFLALSIALFIDYQKIVNVSYFLYGITVILLLFVLFAGKAKGGSHRWISLWAFNF
ncbi:MAG: FtsW/RodA/SpoVE family cell cycle protein, partial [Candidatus Omnitrophica bacterium]|nr:FtsW/RodA/SpoVE family cell cycle protein [Candidatus Omnitrophota bacterium]